MRGVVKKEKVEKVVSMLPTITESSKNCKYFCILAKGNFISD